MKITSTKTVTAFNVELNQQELDAIVRCLNAKIALLERRGNFSSEFQMLEDIRNDLCSARVQQGRVI